MKGEQVVEKILAQARQEAEGILSEARSRLQARRAALQSELEDYSKQTEQAAQQAAEDRQARMLAAARMDLRKRVLAAKADLLNEAFETARRRIHSLPDKAYLDLMERLITQSIQTGDEEVLVGKQETRISHEFLKQINKKLGPGFKGNLRLSAEKADIDGGFLLRRGKVQINNSTDVLTAQVRERVEMDLIKELFAD